MSILAMVATAEKPDKKVLGDLVNTLASLSKDGHISDREMTQLKVYLKRRAEELQGDKFRDTGTRTSGRERGR